MKWPSRLVGCKTRFYLFQIILHSVRKAATAGIPAEVLSQERQTQSTTNCDKEEEQMQPNFERRGDFQGLVTSNILLNNIPICGFEKQLLPTGHKSWEQTPPYVERRLQQTL